MFNNSNSPSSRRQTIRDNLIRSPKADGKQPLPGADDLPRPTSPLFEMGTVLATPGALDALRESGELAEDFLQLHAQGDWGNVFDEDREGNLAATMDGTRIVSAHRTGSGVKLWIVTEAADESGHRPETVILLPSEY